MNVAREQQVLDRLVRDAIQLVPRRDQRGRRDVVLESRAQLARQRSVEQRKRQEVTVAEHEVAVELDLRHT